MKYLHVVLPSKRMMDTYFRMIRKYFDIAEHRFLFWDECVNQDRELFEYGNVGEVQGNTLKEKYLSIYHELNAADVIIWHGLIFGTKRILFLYLHKKFLKKSVWIMRGLDLYNWKQEEKNIKSFIKNKINYKCRKTVPYSVSIFPTDEQIYREQFGNKNKVFFAPYPFSEDAFFTMDKLENMQDRKNGKKYVQVAHNAYTFNNHLDILKSLERFHNEDIKLVVPLSYGNDWTNSEENYINTVIDLAGRSFGEKAECLVRMMPSDEYTYLLCNIDIGIYGAKRQNGLGNILRMLYLGNKVYLNPASPVYKFFKEQHIDVYDMEAISKMSYEEFIAPAQNITLAKRWIREYHHPDCVFLKWRDLFEDLREIFGEKRMFARSSQKEIEEKLAILEKKNDAVKKDVVYKKNYICLDRYMRQEKGTVLKDVKDIVVIGNGTTAKEVFHWLNMDNQKRKRWFIQGFISETNTTLKNEIKNNDVIGGKSTILEFKGKADFVLAVDNRTELEMYSNFMSQHGITPVSYASACSDIGNDIVKGEGCLLGPNSKIANSVILGKYVQIYSSVLERGCVVGDYSIIDSDTWVGKNAVIGSNVTIGAKSIIMPNVKIADGSIIPPRSTVTEDFLGE